MNDKKIIHLVYRFLIRKILLNLKVNNNNVNLGERPYLRARRRVRQRVDAGEPRNSYSSIPGFSFRSSGSSATSNTMMNASGNNLM